MDNKQIAGCLDIIRDKYANELEPELQTALIEAANKIRYTKDKSDV